MNVRRIAALCVLAVAASSGSQATALSVEPIEMVHYEAGGRETDHHELMTFRFVGGVATVSLTRGGRQVVVRQLRSTPGRLELRLPNGARLRVRAVDGGVRVWYRRTNRVRTFRWTDVGPDGQCDWCLDRSAAAAFVGRRFLNGR